MKRFEDFTSEERHTLAEFVYSWEQDILIKPDALDCLKVISNHKLIEIEQYIQLKSLVEKGDEKVSGSIIDILFSEIEEDSGKRIMNEYFNC